MKEFLGSAKGKITLVAIGIAIVAMVVLGVIFLRPNNEEGFRTISISQITGIVKTTYKGKEYAAYKDMKLQDGYILKTDKASFARMILDSDKYIKLEENSQVLFESLGKEGSGLTRISLEYGAITNEIAKGLQSEEEYIIETPNTALAVRGTFFRVEMKKDANGEIYTDIYTYGGTVKVQRVLPSGEMVEENVLIKSGYKTTVCMDGKDTVYVVEEGNENTEPIKIEDIPDGDLVDMYVAASNGHEMFLDVDEIWNEIDGRDIEVEDYTSNRDGQAVNPPDNQDSEGDDSKDTETSDSSGENDTTEKPELTTDIDVEVAREWFYTLDTCYDENGEVIIHADLTRYEEKDIPSQEFDINKYIEMYKAHGYSYEGDESDLLAFNKDIFNKYRTVYYKLVLTDPVLLQEVADGRVKGLIESGQKNPPTEDEMDAFNRYVESIKKVAREDLAVGIQISYNSSKDTYSVWMYGRVRFDGREFINFTENAEWSPQWLAYVAEDRIWLLEWDVEW